MSPQHFLVPMDLSPYSAQAFAYAVSLATKLKARITLLHVLQVLPMAGGDLGIALPPTYIQEVEEATQREMEQYRQRLAEAGITGDIAVVHGVPFQEIIDTARTQKVDLIIMGTHGRTGLSHAFLGSVAEKVVRMAPCPVLVVRQAAE